MAAVDHSEMSDTLLKEAGMQVKSKKWGEEVFRAVGAASSGRPQDSSWEEVTSEWKRHKSH